MAEIETHAEGTGKPEVDPVPAGAARQQCIVCRESILPDAAVCIHCDNVQDWTRHILRWTGVATAVLALLPLWSGALALREIAFPDHKSAVRFLPIACTQDAVTLAITNSGDRPGVLSGFLLRVVVDGRTAEEKYPLIPRGKQRVVRPGETFTLDLAPLVAGAPAGSLPAPPGASRGCEYQIETRVDAFDLEPYSTTLSCPCPH